MRRTSRVRAALAGLALALPVALPVILAGCAPQYTPTIRLALDGPPLAVAARGENSAWYGTMERGCMAGVGSMLLHNTANGVTCTGDMDHPATEKGRLYMDLGCTNGESVALIFRNLGPDQGMGLARMNPEAKNGEQLTLFYHPSPEEAARRLGEVRREIADAREQKRKKDAAAEHGETP